MQAVRLRELAENELPQTHVKRWALSTRDHLGRLRAAISHHTKLHYQVGRKFSERTRLSPCPDLQLQQCIRIAVRELGHVGRGERDAVEEVTTLCIGGIRIVDREHDAVDAEG